MGRASKVGWGGGWGGGGGGHIADPKRGGGEQIGPGDNLPVNIFKI